MQKIPTREWLKHGIELRHFAALEAVATGASFSRAATSLGYTQSAVSQQIAALERIVGQRLVQRPGGQKAVSLTEAGQVLLGHAHAIGSRIAAAEADMDALATGAIGTLRVGSFQSAGARILPEVLRRFLDDHPDVKIELTEAVTDLDLVGQVERGELDHPFLLVIPAGGGSAAFRGNGTNGGRKLPLVCFRSCGATRDVIDFLRSRGFEPNVVLSSDHNETLQGAVAAGLGAALIPRLSLDLSDTATELYGLGEDGPVRLVSIIWHAERSASASVHSFVAAAQEICVKVSDGLERQTEEMIALLPVE
jgi:DNA-binding transcriptional LysR family regulator